MAGTSRVPLWRGRGNGTGKGSGAATGYRRELMRNWCHLLRSRVCFPCCWVLPLASARGGGVERAAGDSNPGAYRAAF